MAKLYEPENAQLDFRSQAESASGDASKLRKCHSSHSGTINVNPSPPFLW